MIRKKEFIIFMVILFICAATLFFRNRYTHSGNAYDRIRIMVSGKIIGIYDLDTDLEIPIGETNICTIHHGYASMTYAQCPDHVCMEMAAIGPNGGQIICLPNEVVIEGIRNSNASEQTNTQTPDIIAS